MRKGNNKSNQTLNHREKSIFKTYKSMCKSVLGVGDKYKVHIYTKHKRNKHVCYRYFIWMMLYVDILQIDHYIESHIYLIKYIKKKEKKRRK